MSDAWLSTALIGLESNQPAPALLWLKSHFAAGGAADPAAADICRRLAALLLVRGDATEEPIAAGAAWSELARKLQIPECLLLALNSEQGNAAPLEGGKARVVSGEFAGTISRAKRSLRIHWRSHLAAEFPLCGFDTTAIPSGAQEVRQKRIDPIYYDPKLSHLPREPHGLRFNRHILQLASGLKIHGMPDWDVNTQGLGLSASDAAIAYAALAIGSRIEIEAIAGEVAKETKAPKKSAPSLRVELDAHIDIVQTDASAWRPIRVTAASINSQAAGQTTATGREFAITAIPANQASSVCSQGDVSSGADGESSWTSSFTTAELAAISWPIEAGPTPPAAPSQEPALFPISEQGAAWPPPTGWQLLQLGLTLTAVVLLGIFAMRGPSSDPSLVKNRPAAPTRPSTSPKPIADTASAAAKTTPPNAAKNSNPPAPLPLASRPMPAATSPVNPGNSPRVEPAIFIEKPMGSDNLPPIVGAEQVPHVTMEVLVPDRAVALGARAIYEIRLKNQSPSAVEGIDVVALFSEGFEPDAADGAPARHAPGRLQFDRIGRLQPGDGITLRVAARAQSAGAHRFRPEVNVANPPQRLHSEVTTRFYAPVSTNPGVDPRR